MKKFVGFTITGMALVIHWILTLFQPLYLLIEKHFDSGFAPRRESKQNKSRPWHWTWWHRMLYHEGEVERQKRHRQHHMDLGRLE